MTGSRRSIAVFTLLYACEGAPIGFIWWALPALLRREGLAVDAITTLTALVVLPWAFKFLWAPLVDVVRGPQWHLRAWIGGAQVVMGLTLVPLLWLDPVSSFGHWRVLLVAHAIAAATQDVAIDALAIRVMPATSRGWLNGAMQAGMLGGRSVFGGGALFASAWLPLSWIIAGVIGWIWLALICLPLAPRVTATSPGPVRRWTPALTSAARRPVTFVMIAFALVAAASFEAAGQLAGPFLVDRGVTAQAIGVIFGLPIVAATLAGGLAGGRLSDRWGRRRSVSVFVVGCALSVAALGAADAAGAPAPVLIALLVAMYVCVGLFTAASYALFMDRTDPALGGTQFSAYMSATNACESWSAWAAGRLVVSGGYPAAFFTMAAVSMASLILVRPATSGGDATRA